MACSTEFIPLIRDALMVQLLIDSSLFPDSYALKEAINESRCRLEKIIHYRCALMLEASSGL